MKLIFNYFFKGLLIVFPVFATLYVVYSGVTWANQRLNDLFFQSLAIDIPGLGILTVFLALVLLGFLFTRAFSRPLIGIMEWVFIRTPLVKIIYTSLKDLTEAFVGEKKRFDRPVLVELHEGVHKLGFITEADLRAFGMRDSVAVYCPHSYNFSGNLFFVDKSKVKPLKMNSSDAMKYVVSAGITHVDSEQD